MKPAELRRLWEDRRAGLRKLAEAVPEGCEDQRAGPGTFSITAHILHLLSAEKTALDALTVTPGKWEWRTGIDSEHYPRRGDVLAILDEQTARARNYFGALTEEQMAATVKLPWGVEPTIEVLWVMWLTHDAHHCGSIVASMRAGGIEPPEIWE
ncbi:MAG: DinB family protein [bacterium]|nr:DinB family protein [bacterium]